MKKKYANEIAVNVTETEANIELVIPTNLFWFEGHFTSQPLLPGVAQLNWVIYYAQKYFRNNLNLSSIEVVKFQCPVLPNDHIILNLHWNEETNKLLFSYTIITSNNKKVASSGKLTLCQ